MPDDLSIPIQPRLATRNYILENLPDEDFNRLLPDLKSVDLKLGQILYYAEEKIDYVYFPNNAMISIVANTSKGESSEVGVIGREGIIGIDVLLGSETANNDNMIQMANGGFRIPVAAAKAEFNRAGVFHDLALRFVRLMMVQISQTALCNRLHTVEERLARWLLMCCDRAADNKLKLTQEFLSIMLGTNRATVTIAAITLQSGGFIKYSRGQILILDRESLEDFSCECYRTVKKEYDRVQI